MMVVAVTFNLKTVPGYFFMITMYIHHALSYIKMKINKEESNQTSSTIFQSPIVLVTLSKLTPIFITRR